MILGASGTAACALHRISPDVTTAMFKRSGPE